MTETIRITKIWIDEKNNEVRADIETYGENGERWAPTSAPLSDVLSALFEGRLNWKEKKD